MWKRYLYGGVGRATSLFGYNYIQPLPFVSKYHQWVCSFTQLLDNGGRVNHGTIQRYTCNRNSLILFLRNQGVRHYGIFHWLAFLKSPCWNSCL